MEKEKVVFIRGRGKKVEAVSLYFNGIVRDFSVC